MRLNLTSLVFGFDGIYVKRHLYLVEYESPATKASNDNTHCQALLVLVIVESIHYHPIFFIKSMIIMIMVTFWLGNHLMPMVMVGISAMPCPQAEMNPYVKATHGRP